MSSEVAERVDFIVQKGAKFYQEFQLTEDDGFTPISLAGKKIECNIKKSYNASSSLFNLTEANGGTSRLDAANGIFCISIESNRTNIAINTGVYNIKIIDDDYPTIETERIVEGTLKFTSDV